MKTTNKSIVSSTSYIDDKKHFIMLHESRGAFIIDVNLLISVFNKCKEKRENEYNSIIKLSSGSEYGAFETAEEIFNIIKQ